DIVRTWLYYSLLRCYLLTGKAPFKHAWIGGLGQDAKGRAMRKSLGNFVDPEPLLQKYGTDNFRFWGASEANLGQDFRLSEDRIAGAGKFLTKLWNTARYLGSFPEPESATMTETDKWIMAELNKLIVECAEGYGDFNMFVPATKIREFLWNVFAAQYIEMTKGRAYGDTGNEKDREAARYTLHRVMRSILLLLAPIIPHVTDYIWRKLYGTATIHLEQFPKVSGYKVPAGVTQTLIDFNVQVWKAKRDKGLALKEPIQIEVPKKLRPYLPDLTRMHHITS
ncbi:MAG: class I tRNA ligase family protein, partial [Thaumarchaeota archaeon]|nr:class I tRNA ligase family protein [Nitrososphaerota archaeon]